MFKKIASAVSTAWSWLEGKKRRIAAVSAVVMTVAKPHTVVYAAAQITAILFGGADLIQNGGKAIKNNLPEGLRKK